MKQYFPVVSICLIILADAFLKSYIRDSAPWNHYYGIISTFALIILFLSSAYLLRYLANSKVGSNLFLKPGSEELGVSRDERPSKTVAIVSFLIIIAAIFRLWRLENIFDGLFWDEAYKGLDAIAIRDFGERPIFLNWNAGREALVAYLVTFFTKIYGYTIFPIRAVEAFAGIATLLFFYLFARKIFNRKIALLCLFLLAFSKYHILYSRFGIRVNLILLFEMASIYFLADALSSPQKNYKSFIACAVSCGLGFYTYIAYRIFPLVLLVFALSKNIRENIRKQIGPIVVAAIIGAVVIAPLGMFYLKNSESFTDRMNRTALWSNQNESFPKLLWESSWKTFAMFTYEGDENPRHNVPHEPALSPFATSFFILGMIVTLANFSKSYARFLFAYFFITILPGILGAAAPHASRNLGALPPALIFCALGLLVALQIFSSVFRSRKLGLIVLAGILFTGPNDALLRDSKILDAQTPDVSSLWGMNISETDVGNYLNLLPQKYKVYLTPQLFFHSTIEYITYKKSEHELIPENAIVPPDQFTMVISQMNPRNLWWLRDDRGKNFFKWWKKNRGIAGSLIHAQILKAYDRQTTRQSDERIMKMIKRNYPSGKELDFDQFTVYIFKS
jgi:Dolichyl-phosphate-mannose-protein mannosyltransferase